MNVNASSVPNNQTLKPFLGQPWLVEERDACGVGFIADVNGKPSHQLIEQTLKALGCMEHRGGCSADNDSGDGAGIMTGIPRELLAGWFKQRNLPLPEVEQLGVGMVFFTPGAIGAGSGTGVRRRSGTGGTVNGDWLA